MKKHLLVAAVASTLVASGAFAAPSIEEKLEILQQEIEALKAQLAKNNAAAPATAAASGGSSTNAGGSATTLGGYGEITYNRYTKGANANSEADLRRFVLFFGHRFNENLRFVSELEVEHSLASKSDVGEVAMEQVYIDYRINNALNVKTGLFLVPLGVMNETHEPPTYYGVERNEVETRIIPTTWREGGVGLHGELAPGLKYDAGIVTGFNAGKFNSPSTGFRSGRQKLATARANDLSAYAALNYRGTPGLLLGGGVFTGNSGQDGFTDRGATRQRPLLRNVDARVTLWDLHAKYTHGNLELQALYAKGTLGDAEAVSAAAVAAGSSGAIAKSIYGWYGQAAYHVWRQGDFDLAPFVRYEKYNTQQKVASGFTADPLNDERVTTVGLNFKVHPQVVFKTDYQKYKADSSKNRVNLGVGYMF